jgi:hypothetical protein
LWVVASFFVALTMAVMDSQNGATVMTIKAPKRWATCMVVVESKPVVKLRVRRDQASVLARVLRDMKERYSDQDVCDFLLASCLHELKSQNND